MYVCTLAISHGMHHSFVPCVSGLELLVSLGLLCDSRTQQWGATRFISKEFREQGMRRRNRKKKNMCLLRQYNRGFQLTS
jgi:hypothetical protein